MLNAFCTFLLFYERFITGSGNDTSDTGIGRKTSVLHGAQALHRQRIYGMQDLYYRLQSLAYYKCVD